MTRSEASRLNGAKSRGPITAEGKARSSQNALKHGLTADICICVENPEEFAKFQQRYFDEFNPVGPVETDLVKEMVSAKWRQERVWSLEAASINFRMVHAKEEVDAHYTVTPRVRAAIAFGMESSETQSLRTYARYDAMLGRMYHRALRTLLDLQARRAATHAELQNEPKPTPNQGGAGGFACRDQSFSTPTLGDGFRPCREPNSTNPPVREDGQTTTPEDLAA